MEQLTKQFDQTLCKDVALTDIDMEAVTSFSQEERVQKQTWFHANMTPEELLEQLNLLQKGGLTYGAVLCFGKNPFKWVDGAFTRCTFWTGNNRLEGWEDDQEFRGNLLEQYESSIAFLQENLRLSLVMSTEGSVEQWKIPDVALREAVANALIHRDYAHQRESVRVEIFDNRVEISSPGNLPDGLTIAELGKERRYPTRHRQIAHIFYLCNYVENYGTGIARMKIQMQNVSLPEPQFDADDGTFKVILRRTKPEPNQGVEQQVASLNGAEPDQKGAVPLLADGAEPDQKGTVPLLADGAEPDQKGTVPLLANGAEPDQKGTVPLLADGAEPDQKGTAPLLTDGAEPDQKGTAPLLTDGAGPHFRARPSLLSRERRFVVTRRIIPLLALIMLIVLVGAISLSVFPRLFPSTTPLGIGIVNEPHNEQIGLSDGTYAFDTGTDRADAALKKQAATKLAQGDKVGATSLWNQAVAMDTNDAEALIYLEDQRVLASGSPYITLVVGTMLTGSPDDISSGHDDLQGVYVQQKEYNDGLKLSGGRKVRLLIANAGSNADYVTEVAGQIVQAAKQDATIVGVMGWAFSAYAQKAIPVLTQARIPLVSSTASADSLSGMSSYFFRVVPSNKSQAIAGAKYAEQKLHTSRVALFVDHNNIYSSSLAADFEQQFVPDGNQIVDTESYTVGDKASLPSHLQNALKSNPDLIYFAGYADDLAVLLVNFPTSQPNLQVLGGDGLYNPNAYSSTAKLNLSRVRITTFAYPDEWSILGLNEPLFFFEYSTDFNPTGADHSANPYGFTRADFGVILAYDATYALLQGCQNVLGAGKALTAVTLQDGLAQITGSNAIQGVSGQISFGRDGDPIDKAIVILYVDQNNHTQLVEVQGCFSVGKCQ